MSIRKEQVLFGIVLGLAVWIGSGYFAENVYKTRHRGTAAEFVARDVSPTPLVTDAPPQLVRRDFFTEPSETRPLPPRELAFPPRAPLSLAGLPLDPGPDYRRSWLLLQDGAQVEGVELLQATVAEAESVNGEGEAAGGEQPEQNPIGGMDEAQAAKLYDRIYVVGLRAPFYGRIELQPGVDLFELEEGKQFAGVKLRLRRFSLKDNKLASRLTTFGDDQPIQSIALAGTLRNEVLRRVRKVPEGQPVPAQRQELITWLLEQARTEAWIYDVALQQAEAYVQLSGGALDGLKVMQKVLRARGDLAGELALLNGLSGEGLEAAFQAEGLGVLRARLGLWAEAEALLRKAVQLAPNDAHSHGALAEFLRQRGRSDEAMAAARRARQTLGSVMDSSDKSRIERTILSCQLAVGDLDGARQWNGGTSPYLRGCVAYASGDAATALASFRQTGAGSDSGAALLGQAACLLHTGEWQAAHDLLVRVADQAPMLRHRAASGLALLFSRLSQFDTALGYVDRALEAAPDDPYALYLRGRTLRLMGQFAAAEEALTAALRQRDDFVHAIAEMSAVQVALASGAAAGDQAAALIAARRYADRAVALAPQPVLELLELQGLRAMGAADARAARSAFEKARDLASDDAQKAYAKGALAVVAYSRARVDDAATNLERMERDLGRDSVIGKWAGATLLAIEDHAKKEMLGDSFDRADLGTIWANNNDGTLRASIHDGRLTFRNKFSRGGSGEVSVERVGAVRQGKNFLACAATVELGSTHDVGDSFVGLGIEVQRGRSGVDVSARVGLRDGKPYLSLQDGRENGKDNTTLTWLSPDLLVAGKPQELELRVVPRGDENSRQLSLQVYWNANLVHTHDLKQLTSNTQNELKTILFATGNTQSQVDVAFDDYRLERRKDNK